MLLTEAENTLTIRNILVLVHGKNGYENAQQYYVIRTLPHLLTESRLMLLRTSLTCKDIIIFETHYVKNCSAGLLQGSKEKCVT